MPRPAAPAVAGVARSAKQILLDYVTRFMYEEMSYIVVFEIPVRITAPSIGFGALR